MLMTAAGAIVIVLTLADLLSTTLSVASATGFFSSRLGDALWRTVLRTGPSHRTLRLIGLAIVTGMVTGWVALLWAGWSLVFIGAGDAVVATSDGAPAATGERVFYAGYLVSTLGNGDYTATGTGWQLTSVIASLSGLLTATLAITFLVPMVSGVVHRRQVASQIASLGDTPQHMLARSWNGTDFSALGPHVSNLLSDLQLLTERHLAYPVLHYFHSDQRHTAVAPMVAVLDDTLLLLQRAVRDPGVDALTIAALREAVAELLRLLRQVFIRPADEPPPGPDPQWAARLGAATVDPDTFAGVLDDEAERRRLLEGFVVADGWSWTDVHEATDPGRSQPTTL